MNATKTSAIDGTSLQGEISTTKAQLIATFGAPNWETNQESDKVSIEWAMVFEDGTLATIYDWKRYEEGTPDIDEVYAYHIGGISPLAVERVTEALNKKEIKRSLFVEARLWFDKSGGNTYFTARVWVDGKIISVLPFQYGYGNQFLYEANEELVRLGYLSPEFKGRPLWVGTREALGVDLYYSETHVIKREMFKS